MAYFNQCPVCKANLDPGEKCDCDRKHEENKQLFDQLLVEVDGQISIGGFDYANDSVL